MIDLYSFTPTKHAVHTVISLILTIAIYIRGNSIFNKTGNPKIFIIAVACLMEFLFTVFHLGYSMLADLVYKNDFYYNMQFDYHTMGVVTLSIAGLISALYMPNVNTFSKEKFRKMTYLIFFVVFIVDVLGLEFFRYIFPHQFEFYSMRFVASNPSLEVMNNALFILTAFIYADVLKISGKKAFAFLPIGFFILGAGTIYLFNSEYLVSFHRNYIHIMRNIAFLLIFMGLNAFPPSVSVFNFRQKILAYPALTLIIFTFLFYSICFIFFNVELPEDSLYMFLILYIITLFFAYSFSSKLSKPITEAINYVDNLKPDEQPAEIDGNYRDEIGLLVQKIQNSAEKNWKYLNELKTNQIRIQKLNEKEVLLRKIIETIRSSLDIEKTLSIICEETAKLFNVQRSVITAFQDTIGNEEYSIRKEYKRDNNLKSFIEGKECIKTFYYWKERIISQGRTIAFNNIQESDAPDFFKETYASLGVKSVIVSAIKIGDDVWGAIALSEYDNYRVWTDEEKELLETISDQIYIAINQAEIYQKEKLIAERERLSRSIIEIMRSTTDADVIKKLFVKSFAKLFDADRVFFSDFDQDLNNYAPVSRDFEYLSNPTIISFTKLDWSNADLQHIIKFLLEKREVKIPNMSDYIAQNPKLGKKFLEFYEQSEVKSSYHFPVMHQDKIMGYFCIEFINRAVELKEEDINRIRSICTQTGITLYQGDLYTKMQTVIKSKREFIRGLSSRIQVILHDLTGLTNEMSMVSPKCEYHDKYVMQITHIESLVEVINDYVKKIDEDSNSF